MAIPKSPPITESLNFSHEVLPAAPVELIVDEATMGLTYYDLQSNSAIQNRIHVFEDGTIGGACRDLETDGAMGRWDGDLAP